MNKIAAYKEILAVLEKHKELVTTDITLDVRHNLKNRIKLQELSEEFGIEIRNKNSSPHYVEIGDFSCICHMDGKDRTISWSDDDRQPENEYLYVISFPTGAYIFGQDYPSKTFQGLFQELKSFGPKYSDTANKKLYFTSENAKDVHNAFDGILKKYADKVGEERKARRLAELKEELAKLEDNL